MIVACGSQMKRNVPRSSATVQMYVRTADHPFQLSS